MNIETVLSVEHYTDDLFWFRTTKSDAWQKKNFQPGEFTMIGKPKISTRAYSIATQKMIIWSLHIKVLMALP